VTVSHHKGEGGKLPRETKFIHRHDRALVLLCAAAAVAPFGAAADRSLPETLARMDEAAAKFKGLSANVEYVTHMETIHEEDSQSGTILVKRPRPKELHVKIAIEKPDPKVAVTDGNKGEVYYPRSGEVQKIDLGHKRSLVDMILTLGFGGNSRELENDYQVKLGGAEAVGGESATRLELIPKAPEMLAEWKRIDLWISDKTGYTLQQQFYERGRDYTLIRYTNVRLNPDLPDSDFKLDVPRGTRREDLNKK
jgi:outer membrane lipoprotein-sorting protein